MEKRFFIAFLLSFAFLTLWAKVASPPVSSNRTLTPPVSIPQAKSENKIILEPPSPFPVEENPAAEEKISILENSRLRVELSNIGGTIKKITIKEYGITLPATQILRAEGFEAQVFSLERVSPKTIVYVYQQGADVIRKSYEISTDDYLIEAEIETSKSGKVKMYTLDISSLDKIDERDKSLFEYSVAFADTTFRKSNAFHFEQKENRSEQKDVLWYGFRNRYFSFLVKPEYETAAYQIAIIDPQKAEFINVPRETSGQSKYQFSIYFGPQKQEILQKYGKKFEKIIIYSNFGLVDGVAKLIYSLMIFIHKWIPSWGLSIILLGILIYVVTYPLTLAGLSSMKKMQSLQPQMTKMREQYKSNPQKLNQEMMELYKKHKVNPMGGCLPMIVQMPVFIGLYQILWRSVVLKGEKFLWIKDLSEPDRLITLKQAVPLMGTEFNILPILMAGVMALQQKLSMKTMNISDPAQASQQKMMVIFLPIMMLAIFYKAASGLTLYFTILYLMTTLTQWKMLKTTTVQPT